jgi:HD-like signal output (HDOD) protein
MRNGGVPTVCFGSQNEIRRAHLERCTPLLKKYLLSADKQLTGTNSASRVQRHSHAAHLRDDRSRPQNRTGRKGAAMGTELQSGQAPSLPWAYLRLPPFPQVAIRVLQLANDENVQLHQLCDLISSDPAFASEVLTVANSLLYAPRYPSTSILQAVAVLGANTLQGMCVTVGVRAYLGRQMSFPALRKLWRHNIACAIIAQRMASTGFIDKDLAYTSGILHDIGRMALAVLQPKAYAELLETHRGPAASVLKAERNLFGLDRCETGRQLIADWKLPVNLESVVADHLGARREDGAWDVPELVKVSCAMANAVGYAAFPGCEPAAYRDLLEQLPARERRLFHVDAESLQRDVAENIKAIESV